MQKKWNKWQVASLKKKKKEHCSLGFNDLALMGSPFGVVGQ